MQQKRLRAFAPWCLGALQASRRVQHPPGGQCAAIATARGRVLGTGYSSGSRVAGREVVQAVAPQLNRAQYSHTVLGDLKRSGHYVVAGIFGRAIFKDSSSLS